MLANWVAGPSTRPWARGRQRRARRLVDLLRRALWARKQISALLDWIPDVASTIQIVIRDAVAASLSGLAVVLASVPALAADFSNGSAAFYLSAGLAAALSVFASTSFKKASLTAPWMDFKKNVLSRHAVTIVSAV